MDVELHSDDEMLRTLRILLPIGVVSLFAFLGGQNLAQADPGKPVAVRWWGRSMVSIETYWNLRIIIDPYNAGLGRAEPDVSGDLVLFTDVGANRHHADLVGGRPTFVPGLDEEGGVRRLHHVLDRLPNMSAPTWEEAKRRAPRSAHAVVVTSIPFWRDDARGENRGTSATLLIEVDGVRIVHCGRLPPRAITNDQAPKAERIDVLLIPVGGKVAVEAREAADFVRQLKPRIVVPIHDKTRAPHSDLQAGEPIADWLAPDYQVIRPVGNTFAVSQADRRRVESRKIVLPRHEPWTLPEELAALFARKESACRASQAVMATLSAKQMNFRPSNGTHTPRWNAEHMMGRELGFFSQIFAKVDPAVPPIDLNPKQMPPDYVAAHPNWSGDEEARQMERVTAFTRRFAYLLDGVNLDVEAPGSRWTPRRLLEQMERHYEEHTENVKKKFALPDWPAP